MVNIDELERLRGALENIGNLSLDGCIKVNTPHGLWVGTPDAYAREVLGMPWRAPEGHQRMTDTEIRELRAENARLKGHWSALDKALADNIIETDQPHRVRWEGEWHYGPLADAYFAMIGAVRDCARAALGEPQ